MDRDSIERIRQMTKDKITVSNFQKDQNMSNKNRRLSIRKIASVACICLVLTSGIPTLSNLLAILVCFKSNTPPS